MNLDFSLAKCKTKAAFSAKLKNPCKLNLAKIKEKFEVVLETPILLVIKENGVEIIVHGYGELMFKNCNDTEFMEKVAKKIYEKGLDK
ncbi:hypothetical protein J4444_04275 [Candidatus Woesearchaeota archaeon]|nr:hypothetical protein [Candidatus Woesearchaeota archaeon]